jgi:hypothetical protein
MFTSALGTVVDLVGRVEGEIVLGCHGCRIVRAGNRERKRWTKVEA